MLDLALEALKARAILEVTAGRSKGMTDTMREALRALHRSELAVLHLMTLACAGDRRDLDALIERYRPMPGSPTYACSAQGGSAFFLRSAWAAARMGRAALPRYREALDGAKDWFAALDATMAIGAISLRHSGAKTEARRVLESYGTPVEGEVSIGAVRAAMAASMLGILDDPDACVRGTVDTGRDLAVQMGAGLPDGHPLRYAAPEDVPDAVARTVALSFDADVQDIDGMTFTTCGTVVAARASAEDFYLPREHVRAWLGAWDPAETIARLQRAVDKRPKPQTARSITPGRNDPCPCGSGKKWKKCHGG